MYDVKSESFQELQNKRRSLPSQLTIIPNMAPIVRNLETLSGIWSFLQKHYVQFL